MDKIVNFIRSRDWDLLLLGFAIATTMFGFGFRDGFSVVIGILLIINSSISLKLNNGGKKK